MIMICARCDKTGIRWEGWRAGNFTHTKCPHCGGVNCQKPPEPECTCDLEDGEHDDDCMMMD